MMEQLSDAYFPSELSSKSTENSVTADVRVEYNRRSLLRPYWLTPRFDGTQPEQRISWSTVTTPKVKSANHWSFLKIFSKTMTPRNGSRLGPAFPDAVFDAVHLLQSAFRPK